MFSSVQDFQDNYIQSFTTGIYKRQIDLFVRKIINAKSKALKDDYTYLLYTTYLQLFENFQIFLLVVFGTHGIENIFNSTKQTTKRFDDLFEQSKAKSDFRNEQSFKNTLNQMIGSFIGEQFGEYHKFVKDAFEDYKNHKDLLNSFKHGFRLNSHGQQTVSIGRHTTMHSIIVCDSTLTYYIQKDDKITEISHSFNFEYIVIKAKFLINIIDNIKTLYLKKGKTSIIPPIQDSSLKKDKSTFKTDIFKISPL